MEKGRLIIDGVDVSGSVGSAASVPYSNTNSGLEATNTQGAIDELATSVTELNSNLAERIQWWIDHHYLPDPLNASLYLYSYGNVYNAITNGYIGLEWGSGGTLTFMSEYMSLVTNSGSSNYIAAYTNNKIDLTSYKKLRAKVNFTRNTEGSVFILASPDKTTTPNQLDSNLFGKYDNSVNGEIEIDVTGISGEYYVGVGVRAYNSKVETALVYEIWLE